VLIPEIQDVRECTPDREEGHYGYADTDGRRDHRHCTNDCFVITKSRPEAPNADTRKDEKYQRGWNGHRQIEPRI